ncbi:HAD hydrolase-like protein, partial [Crocinitomicaceae bacterium]|nr:HAD hydrolase-like protein [Crocinitomicaceae bacterium]
MPLTEAAVMTAHDKSRLIEFRPQNAYFVGVDSDGCVFDNMGIKQEECFCPLMIGYFGLQPVARAARQCKVFADLHSKTRGANRHITIVRILEDLLPSHPMLKEREFRVPDFSHYCAWVKEPGSLLSVNGLREAARTAISDEAKRQLEQALAWSLRVDEMVAEIVKDIPPVPGVHECLAGFQHRADIMVCSSTPLEALEREWGEHGLDRHVQLIASQELGTKAEHLELAARGKYDSDHVLMIGDAPGDARAAQQVGALFYPIIPGREVDSWRRLRNEAMGRF